MEQQMTSQSDEKWVSVERADGVPLSASELIPLIKARKSMAEALASRFGEGVSAWFKGYNDMTENNYFVSDFCFMLELCEAQNRRIKQLEAEAAELRYEIEAKS